MAANEFTVYILRCGDDTFYTGIAVDIGKRISEHESSSRGAKYLKGRGPLTLVYSMAVGNRAAATRVEYRIKQMNRAQKEALIDGRLGLQDLLPDQVSVAG